MLQPRVYKTFPFNPSVSMYDNFIAQIEQADKNHINHVLGFMDGDSRPKMVILEALCLARGAVAHQPVNLSENLQKVEKRTIKAIGDMFEQVEPYDLALLLGQDKEIGGMAKSMILMAIESLEKYLAHPTVKAL